MLNSHDHLVISHTAPCVIQVLTVHCCWQVIDLILLYDGDVMKFAGDSMIVAFSPGRDEKVDEDGGLKAATVRCLHCATHLVDKYGT